MGDGDLELAQLLCTRLCHDLAGPVGAVAAGVELIGNDPTQVDAETLGLIGGSSAAASAKLKFLRAALGTAGGAVDLKSLLDGYLDAVAGPGGKPVVTWPSDAALAAAAKAIGPAWSQAALNLCLLALESQPGCRALAFDVAAGEAVVVTVDARAAQGRAAAVRAEIAAAATGGQDAAPLSAKTIQAHVAGRVVRAAGGGLSLAAVDNGVIVTAMFKGGQPPS